MSAPRGLTTVAGEQTHRPMQKRPACSSEAGPFRQPGRSRDRSAMSMNLMDYALTGKPGRWAKTLGATTSSQIQTQNGPRPFIQGREPFRKPSDLETTRQCL